MGEGRIKLNFVNSWSEKMFLRAKTKTQTGEGNLIKDKPNYITSMLGNTT